MKKSIFTILVIALVALMSTEVSAQKFSKLDKSPLDIAAYPSSHREANKLIKVTYSRPFLKGRSVASLAPNGKVWRTGANEAVEITFYKDVNFGGEEVKAGTYSLFTIPGAKEWTFILNSDTNVWGAYTYKEKNDIVRTKGKVSKGATKLENFSVAFEKDMTLCLGWDTMVVKLPVSIQE